MYINASRELLSKLIISIVGIVGIFLSLYTVSSIYHKVWCSPFSVPNFTTYFPILAFVYFVVNMITGYNKRFFKRSLYGESVIIFQIICIIVSALILILFWSHLIIDSHRLIIGSFALTFFFVDIALRTITKAFLLKVFYNSKFSSKLLIVTDNANAEAVLKSLSPYFDWSRSICGVCIMDGDEDATDVSDPNKLSQIEGRQVVCTRKNFLEYTSHNNVDEIFVILDSFHSDTNLRDQLMQIEEMGIKISINIDLFNYLPTSFAKIDKIGGFHTVSISRNYHSFKERFAKKVLDYAGGLVGFLIFCIAFIFIAPIIKLDSKGPVIFAQPRVGKNGRIFKCYKFRSMRTDAEDLKKQLMKNNEMNGLMFKMENDPRITRVGKLIRKTSIDELPQFINVLKGDMSLVGTRPPTIDEYEKYEPRHKARVSMTTGLTGLWQVSGRSNIKDFNDVVKLDMEYIDNWSIWLDIKIILLTIKVVLFGKGAS